MESEAAASGPLIARSGTPPDHHHHHHRRDVHDAHRIVARFVNSFRLGHQSRASKVPPLPAPVVAVSATAPTVAEVVTVLATSPTIYFRR